MSRPHGQGLSMSASVSNRAYWDRRMDPIDWKQSVEAVGHDRWRQGHDCFLSPETAAAVAALEPLRDRRLLELACGLGTGTAHLVRRGARVTAVDLSPRRVAEARRRQPAADGDHAPRFCSADVERLPFADGSFDRVFVRDVLMYTDPQRTLAECYRVLVPGGRAAVVESLAGPAALRGYRRLTSPAEYRRFTRHLTWSQMQGVDSPLRPVSIEPHHLLSLAAFAALFVFRSPRLYRRMLDVLQPADRRLLDRFPFLARFAWRATAVYDRPRRG